MDDIIPPDRGNHAAIAVEGNDVSTSFRTSGESFVAFSRGHIPQENITVLTHSCERGTVTTEGHNASSATSVKSSSGVRIHIHQLNIVVPPANCQRPTLTTIGNRRSSRITCVFYQDFSDLVRGYIPWPSH